MSDAPKKAGFMGRLFGRSEAPAVVTIPGIQPEPDICAEAVVEPKKGWFARLTSGLA